MTSTIETDANALTADQLEAFAGDGFVVLPGRFDADEVKQINEAFSLLAAQDCPENIREKSSGVVRTAMGLHLRHRLFAQLVNDARLLAPARQILGDSDIYAQQVKVNAKQAFTGEQWQWHYDFATHHHEDGVPEPIALNIHIFLDEVTEFNGPLVFIPGSHLDGPAPTSLDTETTSFPLWTVGPDVVGPLAERCGLASPKGAAGTVLIFGDTLIHGSPSNMSPWQRRIFSLIVNPTSNRQRTGRRPEHLHHRDTTPLSEVGGEFPAE